MIERIVTLESLRERLNDSIRGYASHLTTSHGGRRPGTACHKCINYQAGIRLIRETLQERDTKKR